MIRFFFIKYQTEEAVESVAGYANINWDIALKDADGNVFYCCFDEYEEVTDDVYVTKAKNAVEKLGLKPVDFIVSDS